MNVHYMVACGMVWHKTADPDAGLELVEALGSPDPELRQIARHMLMQRRDNAVTLLEGAIVSGILNPEIAGGCMVELLRLSPSDIFIVPTGVA